MQNSAISKDSDEDEWVEEEQMVVVELSGIIDPEYLSKCQNSSLKVLGIETDEPVLQLGSYIFSGQHKTIPGTAVLFEKTQASKGRSSGSLQWKYKCNTTKKIEMQRVHLKPKQRAQDPAMEMSSTQAAAAEGTEEQAPKAEPTEEAPT